MRPLSVAVPHLGIYQQNAHRPPRAVPYGDCELMNRRTLTGLLGTAVLTVPLPQTPATGDTFTIYPGCGRTAAACAGYSNSNNYQGFPYVPPTSTSL